MPNADTAAMTAAYQAKKHTQDALHVVNSTLPQPVISVPHHEIAKFSHTKKVGQYLLGKTLGEGSFAKVKEGLHVITGETVAVKIIDKMKARQDPYIRRNMRREGKILQMVRHPNIIKLLETMETDNHYYLIMEFCRNGNVMSKVTTASNCTGMSEAEVRKYLRQLISAVDYLHRAGIVHRDLKIENLLLDNDDNIRLIDFGLSNCMKCLQKSGSVNDPVTTPRTLFHTQCGSPAYAAPELLSRKTYSTKVDVWSVGVNMFVLLTGRLPFTVEPYNLKKLFSKMIHRDMNSIPPFLSQDCRHLMLKLLDPDPMKRPTLESVMSHPWLNKSCIQLEPVEVPNYLTHRNLNQQILAHMSKRMQYRMSDVIKAIVTNKSINASAVYYLLLQRLYKYNAMKQKKKKTDKVTKLQGSMPTINSIVSNQGIGKIKNLRKGEYAEWVAVKIPNGETAQYGEIISTKKISYIDRTNLTQHVENKPSKQEIREEKIQQVIHSTFDEQQNNSDEKDEECNVTAIEKCFSHEPWERDGYTARQNTPEDFDNIPGALSSTKESLHLKPALKKENKVITTANKKRVTICDEKAESVKAASIATVTYPLSFRQMYQFNREKNGGHLLEIKKSLGLPRKVNKTRNSKISKTSSFVIARSHIVISISNNKQYSSVTSTNIPSLTREKTSSPISLFFDPVTHRVKAKVAGRPKTKYKSDTKEKAETKTIVIPPIVMKPQAKTRIPSPQMKTTLRLPELDVPLVDSKTTNAIVAALNNMSV